MNMSMDKPMALNRAEGTRGPQVKNAKINENDAPKASELEYEHVHGQIDCAESSSRN